MTILEQIDDIKKDKSVLWRYGKSKKEVLADILAAVRGLIAGRSYLPDDYKLHEVIGLPESWQVTPTRQEGMSYCQMYNYVVRYIKTGKHLKKPYRIINSYED